MNTDSVATTSIPRIVLVEYPLKLVSSAALSCLPTPAVNSAFALYKTMGKVLGKFHVDFRWSAPKKRLVWMYGFRHFGESVPSTLFRLLFPDEPPLPQTYLNSQIRDTLKRQMLKVVTIQLGPPAHIVVEPHLREQAPIFRVDPPGWISGLCSFTKNTIANYIALAIVWPQSRKFFHLFNLFKGVPYLSTFHDYGFGYVDYLAGNAYGFFSYCLNPFYSDLAQSFIGVWDARGNYSFRRPLGGIALIVLGSLLAKYFSSGIEDDDTPASKIFSQSNQADVANTCYKELRTALFDQLEEQQKQDIVLGKESLPENRPTSGTFWRVPLINNPHVAQRQVQPPAGGTPRAATSVPAGAEATSSSAALGHIAVTPGTSVVLAPYDSTPPATPTRGNGQSPPATPGDFGMAVQPLSPQSPVNIYVSPGNGVQVRSTAQARRELITLMAASANQDAINAALTAMGSAELTAEEIAEHFQPDA